MNIKLNHSRIYRYYIKPTVFYSLNFYRQYRTTSFDYNKNESRYNVPASMEWKNSSYCYNNSMVDMPFYQKYSSTILRNYFNLDFSYKRNKNFKRLPIYKLLKLFPKNYFSLPKIKDSNNKTIVTLYIYNRERKLIANEFFFLKNIYRKQKIKRNSGVSTRTLKRLKRKIKLTYLRKDYNRYLLEAFTKDVRKFTQFLLKKRLIFKTLLFYSFLKWALSMLKIKLYIYITKKEGNKNFTRENYIRKIKLIRGKYFDVYIFKNPMVINLRTLNYVNVILMSYMKEFYSKNDNIKLLYNVFKHKSYNKIQDAYFKNEFLGLDYLLRLRMQINKLYNYIPVLKMYLRKILSKKVVINVVDLKYFYMNSDIYSQVNSLILKDKKPNIKSLAKINRLIKVQNLYNNNFNINYNNIFTKRVNLNSGINNKYKDLLHKTVQNMFRRNLSNNLNKIDKLKSVFNKSWKTNIDHVLNYLKHKWITGVRVEAKGRLSQRNTAKRSKYMFLYKGNLRIMQHITDPDLKLNNNKLEKLPAAALIRGRYTSNLEYSYLGSKIRAGAFGVKGWISSN